MSLCVAQDTYNTVNGSNQYALQFESKYIRSYKYFGKLTLTDRDLCR